MRRGQRLNDTPPVPEIQFHLTVYEYHELLRSLESQIRIVNFPRLEVSVRLLEKLASQAIVTVYSSSASKQDTPTITDDPLKAKKSWWRKR